MSNFGIGFEVEVKGLKEQLRKLEGFGATAQRRLVPAMEDALMMVGDEAKRRAPVGVSGALRSSIGGKVTYAMGTDVRGVVGSALPYAAAVEKGSRPHYPPVANIAYWVDRKLGLRDAMEIYGTALAIARKIGARGTKARPFLFPALEKMMTAVNRRFKKAADDALKDLEVRP